MKRIILILLFALAYLSSYAQSFYNRWVPTSGTDTYTTNITSFTSLSNSVIYVKFTNTNTTAATITINGTLGPAPIRAWDGDSWEVLSGGELDVNTIYKLSYQGSYYELEGIGSGSSLFPTTGTGTATGNVTGDLDGNQLQIINTDYVNIQSGVSQVEFNNSTFAILNDGSQIVLEDATGLDLRTGTGNSRLLIEPDGSFNLAGDNGTSGQVLTSAGSGAAPTWEDPASVSLGTEGQIPVMNSTDDDFVYSDKFKWDDTDNNFIAGNGTTSGGTNNINFGDATTLTGSWSLTSAEESTVRGNNNTSSGWDVTVGDNTNANSGNGTTTSGIDNINYGIGSYVGGIGAQLSYVGNSQRGGFVHAFSAGSVDGKKPSGVEYLIANDGAFNVSRNTASQTSTHGSLAQDGAILGGIDHNIPSTSPRSAIFGGNAIKARPNDPDNVYVPYFNVTQMDQDSSISRILVQNGTTKKLHYRSVSTIGLESVSVTTTGGTITLDFHSGDNDDAVEKMFIGSATFSSSKAVDFSNSSGKLVFNFHFEITNVAGTITCASCIMSDEDDKWDSGTDTWTPTQTGKYEMGGTWDGSAWKTKIMGPFN